MEKNKLIGWIALFIFVAILLATANIFPREWHKFGLTEFVNVALSLFGIKSSIRLINQGFISPKLRTLLGSDLFILFLGASAVIWVSMQQILQIFSL